MKGGNTFEHDIDDKVRITRTGETGIVAGRAEYKDSNPQYWLRYEDGVGSAKDGWFYSSELAAQG